MDLQPDNGFVVDRVVDAKNDIERPHYEFQFHGLVYHLPLREELDSVDYRKRLVNLLNADPYLKECGMALDDYYQKHPDMEIKAAGPVGSRPYIEEAVGLDQSVLSSMRSVQKRLDSFLFDKKIAYEYGFCSDSMDVVSVDKDKGTVRVRFNSSNGSIAMFDDGDGLGAYTRGPMVDIPLKNPREDMALFLAELKKSHDFTRSIHDCVVRFNRNRYIEHRDHRRDVMLSGQELDNVLHIINGIDLVKVKKNREDSRNRNLESIVSVRKEMKESLDALIGAQKVRDNRFLGLGYYIDRTFGRKGFLERQKRYENCVKRLSELDAMEKKVKEPFSDVKVMSGALIAAEATFDFRRKLDNREKVEVVMDFGQGRDKQLSKQNRKSAGLSL